MQRVCLNTLNDVINAPAEPGLQPLKEPFGPVPY